MEDEIDDDMKEAETDERDAFNDDTFGSSAGAAPALGALAGGLLPRPSDAGEAERMQQFLRERAELERQREVERHAAAAPHASLLRVAGVPRLGVDQIRLLLSHFGEMRAFSLQPDPSGNNTDVAFVSYADAETEALAIERLDGMVLGAGRLSVSHGVPERAAPPALSPPPAPPAARAQPMPEGALDVSTLESALSSVALPPGSGMLPDGVLDVSTLESSLSGAAIAPPQQQPQQPPQQQPQQQQQWQQPQPQPQPQPPLSAPQRPPPPQADGPALTYAERVAGGPLAPPGLPPPPQPAGPEPSLAQQLGERARALLLRLQQIGLERQRHEMEVAQLRVQLSAVQAQRAKPGQPGSEHARLGQIESALVNRLNSASASGLALHSGALSAQKELAAVQGAMRQQGMAPAHAAPPPPPGAAPTPQGPPPPARPQLQPVIGPYGPNGLPYWAALLPNMPPLPPHVRVGKHMTLAELEVVVRQQHAQVAVSDVLQDDFYAFMKHAKAQGVQLRAPSAEARAAADAKGAAPVPVPSAVLVHLERRKQQQQQHGGGGGGGGTGPQGGRLVDFSASLGQGVMKVHADPGLKLRTPRPLISIPHAAPESGAADEKDEEGMSGRERSAASALSWAVRATVDRARGLLVEMAISRLTAAKRSGGKGGGGKAAVAAEPGAEYAAQLAQLTALLTAAVAAAPAAGAAATPADALLLVVGSAKGRRVVADALAHCAVRGGRGANATAIAAAADELTGRAALALARVLPQYVADRRAPTGKAARRAAAAHAAAEQAKAAQWTELGAALQAAIMAARAPAAPAAAAPLAEAAAALAAVPEAVLAEAAGHTELNGALAALARAGQEGPALDAETAARLESVLQLMVTALAGAPSDEA